MRNYNFFLQSPSKVGLYAQAHRFEFEYHQNVHFLYFELSRILVRVIKAQHIPCENRMIETNNTQILVLLLIKQNSLHLSVVFIITFLCTVFKKNYEIDLFTFISSSRSIQHCTFIFTVNFVLVAFLVII